MNRRDIVSVGLLNKYYLTIAYYREAWYGKIKLGSGRYSFSIWKFALIVEVY
jgi:hypothetical protein